MFRTHIALIAVLLLTLFPAAIIAQETEAELTFPIAVVALDGSYEVADDTTTCELAWASAGTPTLRVTASSDGRFRQNLVEGELVTIPEVDDALICLFVAEVTLPEARRYEVTIEGMEIVELASADLADLEGAVVVPVAMDRDGRYELVTDDYLDLALDNVTGGLRPVDHDEPEPAETPPTEPATLSATTAPSARDGKVIDIDVMLFAYEDVTVLTETGCRIDAPDEDAAVHIEASSGTYRSTWTPGDSGMPVGAEESPVSEGGCVFQRQMRLQGSDSYTVSFNNVRLAEIPYEDLAGRDGAVLLAVDRTGSRTPDEPLTVTPAATPLASPAAENALSAGQHQVVGRLNLWTSSPDDAPFGCAAGPTRTGVYPGAQVVVRDGGAQVIGYGTLIWSDRSGSTVCSFDFTVVVPGTEFYVFEFGNGHRHVTSLAELELWNWHVFIDTAAP